MDPVRIGGFFNRDHLYAIVGASNDPAKYGNKVYRNLKHAGFSVVPVNLREREIDGDPAYPSLDACPTAPDVVVTVAPPEVTEQIVRQCARLGIGRVWMQPGSESEQAVAFCAQRGIAAVHHACIMAEKGDFI
ncbi:CoA-binding protein [Candidatus Woesearchaeota archaeon]|nr:CoA-binding protein [Candidatus Woesearchaeota archaeon]